MDWINYHHLLYFWVTAREGSITRASERLRLAQPTVSGQIQSLEKAIGEKLFLRQGRRLVLTETGKLVLRYADHIFTVGQELVDTLRNRPTDGRQRIVVGVCESVAPLIAHRLIAPLLAGDEDVHLICRDGSSERLLADLGQFDLDVVLSDQPSGNSDSTRAAHHLLGESPVGIYGTPELAQDSKAVFPRSLDGRPMLLPTPSSPLRRALDGWLHGAGAKPRVVAEFDDSAMMIAFGQSGQGLFPAPTCIEAELVAQQGVVPLGVADGVVTAFYALTVERKLENPLVQKIVDGARQRLASLLEASA